MRLDNGRAPTSYRVVAFAHDAVQALPDDRVRVHFKAPWRSSAAHADVTADKFLARLCALIPPQAST